MNITIVIPAFNEETKIENLLKLLSKISFPVVIVDDGSTDKTQAILSKYQLSNTKFKILKHKVNLGKGEALKTGCDYAFTSGATTVVIMDSDGQHEPSDIPRIIKPILMKKCNLVFGARVFKGDIPLERFLYNKFASIVVNVLFQRYISDVLCGFRAFTKDAYKKIRWQAGGYAVDAEMAVRAIKKKITFCEVGVATVYYDKYKGVSIKESIEIFLHLIYWKIFGI
jgi:glycosyltransferase involved in cell wall biosynthesis